MPKMEPAVPSPRALPFRVGPYECYHYLGGNLSEAYLARDSRTGFKRAVKVLAAGYGVEPGLLQRFLADGQTAIECSHPNIAMTYECGQVDRLAYLAMDHLQGETLKVLLERGEPRSMTERIGIAWQLSRGLGYLRVRQMGERQTGEPQIVHRPIKPENVHVAANGHTRIFDFGVVLENESLVRGTPLYMAPEQVRGEALTTASDIYSFGVLLFLIFTGGFPVRGLSRDDLYAAIVFHPPDLRPLRDRGIPHSVAQLIERCLQKQPDSRPATFLEIEEHLRPMVSTAVVKLSEVAVPPGQPTSRSPWPMRLGIGLLLVFGGGFGLTAYVNRPKTVAPRILTNGGYMLLVPTGPALLGADRRAVDVAGFYIDRREVSNEAYRQFSVDTGRDLQMTVLDLPATFPAVNVSYDDATAFCAWAGNRLPSDVEWEKAARGPGGHLYPWGDQPRADLANLPRDAEPHELEPVESNFNGASSYGAINMLGNVWEWVAKPALLDETDLRVYLLTPPVSANERSYQLRGGSFQQTIDWRKAVWHFAAAPARLRRDDIGFRCARDM